MIGVSSCQTDSLNSSPALKNTSPIKRSLLGLHLLAGLVFAQSATGQSDVETKPTQEISLWDATILGVVEGVTEYLPVSSTGHLILSTHFLKLTDEDLLLNADGEPIFLKRPNEENPAGIPLTEQAAIAAYLIIIQFGAIAAVVILYWKRLMTILMGLLGKDPNGLLLLRNLIVAFIPAAIIGLLLEDYIDKFLFGNGPVILALLIGGIAIIFVDRWHRKQNRKDAGPDLHQLSLKQCLFIGGMQCIAMWPGTSRSMMTIIGGYLVKLSPTKAAEFSFLLGLVTLSAASIYKGYKVGIPLIDAYGWAMPLFGCFVAAVSAAVAVKWMVSYLGKHGLALFGYYRIVLSVVLAIVFYI
jgi:undecaprenyl-diphosphatase